MCVCFPRLACFQKKSAQDCLSNIYQCVNWFKVSIFETLCRHIGTKRVLYLTWCNSFKSLFSRTARVDWRGYPFIRDVGLHRVPPSHTNCNNVILWRTETLQWSRLRKLWSVNISGTERYTPERPQHISSTTDWPAASELADINRPSCPSPCLHRGAISTLIFSTQAF